MTPLVAEGLNLALYGMGTVFVFLTLLVIATMLMSWMVAKSTAGTGSAETPIAQIDQKKLAAISAAIHQHRSRS